MTHTCQHTGPGRVLCDDVALLYRTGLEEDRGALSPQTMMKVSAGLRAALAR